MMLPVASEPMRFAYADPPYPAGAVAREWGAYSRQERLAV
jgi:16S rRNA G966 N2-methylase RsmD